MIRFKGASLEYDQLSPRDESSGMVKDRKRMILYFNPFTNK